MTKILFVTEKWCAGDPQFGPSNLRHNIFNTLEQSGLEVNYECVFMDEHLLQFKEPIDATLISKCHFNPPDLVVFSPLMYTHSPHECTLDPVTLSKLGVPVVTLWWDTSYTNRMEVADEFARYSALSLIFDRNDYETVYPHKYLHFPHPHDAKIFNNPRGSREIDVAFLGTTIGHSKRQSGIQALRNAGIEVCQGGGQYGRRLDIRQYAEMYQNAKIVVNFSWTYDTIPVVTPYQLKGRIFEAALCGAMVLDSENPYSKLWFEPEELVTFSSEEDLVEKVKHYLEFEIIRQTTAYQGCKKVQDAYNPRRFWETVLQKVDIDARPDGTSLPEICVSESSGGKH
jgi:hypothetical protein